MSVTRRRIVQHGARSFCESWRTSCTVEEESSTQEDIFSDEDAEHDTNAGGSDDINIVESCSTKEDLVVEAGLDSARFIDGCTVRAVSTQDHEPEQLKKAAWVRASVINLLDEMR